MRLIMILSFVLIISMSCLSLTQKENQKEFERCWKCGIIIPSGSERFHGRTSHGVMPNRYFD